MDTGNNHVVVAGPTGVGKSITILSLNVPLMLKPLKGLPGYRRPAMLWIDLQGPTVQTAAKHGVKAGLMPGDPGGPLSFIYDKGADTKGVPAIPIAVRSTNPDPEQREAENRNTVEELKSILVQAEGKLNTSSNPVIDDGLTDGLNLFIWQDLARPDKQFTDIAKCFRMSEQYRAFERDLSGPKRDAILRKFQRYHEANDREWEYLCGPAVRRLHKLPESPQFRARSRPNPLDLRAFYNRGGVYMYDGESRGNLNRIDNALNAAILLLTTMNLARNGLERKLVIVLDEPVTGGILDLNIARSLDECRKWGVKYGAIAIQNPLSFGDPRIGDSLFGSCKTWIVHKQTNPKACDFFAEGFFQNHFDALEVHYVEERFRTVEDTMQKLPTTSTSVSRGPDGEERTGETAGFVYRPVKRELADRIDRYKTPDVKRSEFKHILATMRTGQVMVRNGDAVTEQPVDVPMLAEPWAGLWFSRHPRVSLADRKLQLALEALRQRPEFQTSVPSGSSTCSPPPSTDDAADKWDAGEL